MGTATAKLRDANQGLMTPLSLSQKNNFEQALELESTSRSSLSDQMLLLGVVLGPRLSVRIWVR
jgi:hypothetical protein